VTDCSWTKQKYSIFHIANIDWLENFFPHINARLKASWVHELLVAVGSQYPIEASDRNFMCPCFEIFPLLPFLCPSLLVGLNLNLDSAGELINSGTGFW